MNCSIIYYKYYALSILQEYRLPYLHQATFCYEVNIFVMMSECSIFDLHSPPARPTITQQLSDICVRWIALTPSRTEIGHLELQPTKISNYMILCIGGAEDFGQTKKRKSLKCIIWKSGPLGKYLYGCVGLTVEITQGINTICLWK